MDLWGEGFVAYAALYAFRDILSEFARKYPGSLIIIILSAGFIAAGNGFAHWQYHPGQTLRSVSTAMVMVGLLGVVLVTERQSKLDLRIDLFDKHGLYRSCVVIFLVLPIIYGGLPGVLNLLVWGLCTGMIGQYLVAKHPRLASNKEQDPPLMTAKANPEEPRTQ
jgi:hypothetical protein